MDSSMTREDRKFDVIVIGGGIMGSCTAYEAAKRGHTTLLLEQFDLLHNRGSSHGESRTLRITYPQSHYSAMVLESSRLWEEAQAHIGYKVFYRTNQLDLGPSHDPSLTAIISSCHANSVDFRVLDRVQVDKEYSGGVVLPEGYIGVVSEGAGIIKPTKAVCMFQTLARQNGALLKDNTQVTDITPAPDGVGVIVSTASGDRFEGKKCVVTAGAWMNKLVKNVVGREVPIQPLETGISYWKIKKGFEKDYTLEGGFPTFASYGDPLIYGTPAFEYPGLIKVAVHGGVQSDPENRTWVPDERSVESLRKWVSERFGGRVENDGPVTTQSCMYSMTPDEDFVIDFLGGEFGKDVVIGGGFSGHGFKMGPVIGRVLADLALNGVAHGIELDHFNLSRFDTNPVVSKL